jgi:type I restriction enzyme, S subunit
LSEIGELFGGLTGKSKPDFTDGNARYVSYMNVFSNLAVDVLPPDRVRVAAGERQRRLHRGDVLFTGSSETPDECGMSAVVTSEPPEALYLNSFCIGYRPHEEVWDPDFAKHLFRSSEMRNAISRCASGVTRFNVSKARLAKVVAPVPAFTEQVRIAAILDKFDALVNDLSSGLPAELAARRMQYEYYRNKLLTFEEAV